jgi:DnaJ-class molecular chaperone
MTRSDAMTTLGLCLGVFYEKHEVRSAYARAVMADHPDHGGDGTRLASLQLARDTLLSQGEIKACVLCKGSGKVRVRFGAQTCTACEGSGDQI